MHPQKIQYLVDGLAHLGQVVASGEHEGHVFDEFVFGREDTERFIQLLNSLSSAEPWRSRATRGEVNHFLQGLVRKVSEGMIRTDLEEIVAAEEQTLYVAPNQLVVLPVQGLYVSHGRLDMGRVIFQHLATATIEPLVRAHVQGSEALIRKSIKTVMGFENMMVSLYTAPGTDKRVRHDAVLHTRTSLHFLRGLAMVGHSHPRTVELAVSGDERIGAHAGMVLHAGGMTAGQHSLEHVSVDDLWITMEYLQAFDSVGLAQVRTSLNLAPDARNTWQKSLLRSYEWLGTAQLQQEPESAFLMLAVVLEILFTGQGGVGDTIADAVAFLTAQGTDNRLAKRKQVKELYDLRSNITHGRTSTTMTWAKVDELRLVLREALQAIMLVSSSWTTRDNLRQHLDQLKYS